MPRRPREPEPVLDESKRWLDSYADAVTLLLAFFIMLFAFSLVDPVKFTDFKFGVAQALGKPNPTLEGGLGLLDRGNGVAPDVAVPPVSTRGGDDGTEHQFEGRGELTQADADALAEALREALARAGVAEDVSVDRDPRGVVLRFEDHVLFDSGEAVIRLEGARVLSSVAEVLRPIDNQLVVEGHTDNVPTSGTSWPTNWELSVARATTVLRWLSEGRGIPPVRLSASGYADTRPIATNETSDGRAQNRRVELVVLMEAVDGSVPSLGLGDEARPADEEPVGVDDGGGDREGDATGDAVDAAGEDLGDEGTGAPTGDPQPTEEQEPTEDQEPAGQQD